MKIVIIGAYGHIGSFLVPKLVNDNNQVIAISRGKHQPYVQDKSWNQVEHLSLDRANPEFTKNIVKLDADVVVDLINFNIKDTKEMVETLRETSLSHYLFCSSIWAHGRAEILPADPNIAKKPLDAYGIDKYESEEYLKEQYRKNGFPATIIMPGQISGPGWTIINPVGNTDIRIFQAIANGETTVLPNFGMETLHHVHADDVAQVFHKAILHRNQALGESFHAVAADSMTLYGYAAEMYRFFGRTPKIDFLSWPEWKKFTNDDDLTEHTYYHIARSGYYSIENAKKLIDYSPKYTTLETVKQAVESYISRGLVTVDV